MWIQVRTIDGSQTRTIEDVSRKATIEELRERVWALFDVRPECQRLFYRGKQVRRAPRGAPHPGVAVEGAPRLLLPHPYTAPHCPSPASPLLLPTE